MRGKIHRITCATRTKWRVYNKAHPYFDQNQESWLPSQNDCSMSEILTLIYKWIYATYTQGALGPLL